MSVRSTLACALSILLCFTSLAPAHAEDATLPRVRVLAIPLAHPLSGTLARADSAALQLEGVEDLGRVEILRGAVIRYEVSRGKRDYPFQGAVLGGLFGAISLTVVGLIVEKEPVGACYDCIPPYPGDTTAGYYTIAGAALGLVLGMLVGASIDRDRWEAVEVPASGSNLPTGAR